LLGSFRVFYGLSYNDLDNELNKVVTSQSQFVYISINNEFILGMQAKGSGNIFGRQLRYRYFDNKTYSRYRQYTDPWTEWITIS
jgi:hypothetical protein